MSIRVMSWVWEHSPASGSDLLLLLAIADFADDAGSAYPSADTLAVKTRMSRSSVFRAQKRLIESGDLEVAERGTGRSTSRYRIVMAPRSGVNLTTQGSQNDTTTGFEGGQIDHPGVSDCTPRDVTGDHPGMSLLTHRTVNEPSSTTYVGSTGGRNARRSAPTDRGTRIPDDFALTEPMRAWGREKFPHLDGESETAAFIDYWKSVPGAKGRKLDWTATWRTWIRRAAERAPHPGGPRTTPAGPSRPSTTDARVADAFALAQRYAAEDGTQLPINGAHPNRLEITP